MKNTPPASEPANEAVSATGRPEETVVETNTVVVDNTEAPEAEFVEPVEENSSTIGNGTVLTELK